MSDFAPATRRARPKHLAGGAIVAILALAAACGPAAAVTGATEPTVVASPSIGPLPACRYDDLLAARVSYDDWQTTLVDTIYRLPPGYSPPDLVPITEAGLQGRGSVRRLAVGDLAEMASAARRAGATLTVVSAFRDEQSQAQVFAEWEAVAGHDAALATAARPGHSEHQLGTAVDFGSPGDVEPWVGDWGASPQGRWLAENGWRYGFVMSYPAAASPSKTCYDAEPWHYRYYGRQLAAEIHASGLAPRVFLWDRGAGAAAAVAHPVAERRGREAPPSPPLAAAVEARASVESAAPAGGSPDRLAEPASRADPGPLPAPASPIALAAVLLAAAGVAASRPVRRTVGAVASRATRQGTRPVEARRASIRVTRRPRC